MKLTGTCGFTCFPTKSNPNHELLEPSKHRTAKRRVLKSIQASYIMHGEGGRARDGEGRNTLQVPSLCGAGHWPFCHTNHPEGGQKTECQRVTLMWVILPSSRSLLITVCNLISNVTLERKLGKGLGPGREALISPLEAYSELNRQINKWKFKN